MNTETAEAMRLSADSAVLNALLQIKSRWPEAPHCGLNRQGLLAAPLQQAQMLWLNAPAGYGKSVLMADYARAQQALGVPVLWCRIDSQDQPAAQFLLHLLELAARHWPAIEQTALAHWYETGHGGGLAGRCLPTADWPGLVCAGPAQLSADGGDSTCRTCSSAAGFTSRTGRST